MISQLSTSIYSQIPWDFPYCTYIFLMIFPNDFPMISYDFPIFSYIFLWFPYDFLWFPNDFPMIFLWFPYTFSDFQGISLQNRCRWVWALGRKTSLWPSLLYWEPHNSYISRGFIAIISIVTICYYMLLYVTICMYMLLYVTICYYMLLYVTMCYYMLLYVTICYYMLLYVTICYYMLLYVTICYYMLLYVTICYYMLLYVTICYYSIHGQKINRQCVFGGACVLEAKEGDSLGRWSSIQ